MQWRIPQGTGPIAAIKLLWWGRRCPHYKVGPWPGEPAGSDYRCLRCGRLPHTWATDDEDLLDFMEAGSNEAKRK